jgi:hypothetical protein
MEDGAMRQRMQYFLRAEKGKEIRFSLELLRKDAALLTLIFRILSWTIKK